jgi:hypothetical protein
MKNQITIGGKIGYLNLKTGKYKFVEIIGIDAETLKMQEHKRQNHFGRSYSEWTNEYTEKISDIIKYLKTPSIDFKDGRPLLKYKGTTKLY